MDGPANWSVSPASIGYWWVLVVGLVVGFTISCDLDYHQPHGKRFVDGSSYIRDFTHARTFR